MRQHVGAEWGARDSRSEKLHDIKVLRKDTRTAVEDTENTPPLVESRLKHMCSRNIVKEVTGK